MEARWAFCRPWCRDGPCAQTEAERVGRSAEPPDRTLSVVGADRAVPANGRTRADVQPVFLGQRTPETAAVCAVCAVCPGGGLCLGLLTGTRTRSRGRRGIPRADATA